MVYENADKRFSGFCGMTKPILRNFTQLLPVQKNFHSRLSAFVNLHAQNLMSDCTNDV